MEVFGYNFPRKRKPFPSFAPEQYDDGAVMVAAGGNYGTYFDLDGTVRTDAELVTRYRDMALHPEVEAAITNIVNDAIVNHEEDDVCEMLLDKISDDILPGRIKEILNGEFKETLNLLNWNNFCYEIFQRWLVDGRLYYHAIIDPKVPQEGIQELRYVDPRKIRKVREVSRKRLPMKSPEGIAQQTEAEYYVYSDKGFNTDPRSNSLGTSNATAGLRISNDSIVYITSGLTDSKGSTVLSYLHKAIKPLNQLRVLEDATVIYRISRAPERRIFYIDVGNLPKMKAEQYLRDMMQKHKNKLVYDAVSGEIRDDRKFLTMLEDYWFPRRSDGKATDVQTLPAGENLGQIEDVRYFQKRLFRSLSVPLSRLDEESQTFSLGREGEISRDEVNFARFIDRLRVRFAMLFLKIMEKQVILKMIMSPDEWARIEGMITFRWAKDNYYAELKDGEILESRMNRLMAIQPFIGLYYSHQYVRDKVLYQDRELQAEIDLEIELEMNDPRWNPMMNEDPRLDDGIETDGSTSPIPPDMAAGGRSGGPGTKKGSVRDRRGQIKAQAAALGLEYAGFGRWADRNNQVTHVEEGGILVKKKPSDK